MDTKTAKAKGEAARNKVLIKRVRPWVRLSLGFSTIAFGYGLARQSGLLRDRETVVRFDLAAIER